MDSTSSSVERTAAIIEIISYLKIIEAVTYRWTNLAPRAAVLACGVYFWIAQADSAGREGDRPAWAWPRLLNRNSRRVRAVFGISDEKRADTVWGFGWSCHFSSRYFTLLTRVVYSETVSVTISTRSVSLGDNDKRE